MNNQKLRPVLLFFLVQAALLATVKCFHILSAVKCSESDATRMAKKFISMDKDKTNCPSESWLTVMAADDIKNTDKVLINIGMNKGYNFAVWMNLFAKWTNVTPQMWHKTILRVAPKIDNKDWGCESCGCCGDCREVFDTSSIHSIQPPTTITSRNNNKEVPHHRMSGMKLFGIDMNNGSVTVVNDILRQMPTVDGSVSLNGLHFHTMYAAASDYSGSIKIPECPPGREVCSLMTISQQDSDSLTNEQLSEKYKATITEVPVITVEKLISDLVAEKRIHYRMNARVKIPAITTTDGVGAGATESSQNSSVTTATASTSLRDSTLLHPHTYLVDILQIDTEGYDALVLTGTYSLLEAHQIRMLVFEYHKLGPWKETKLEPIAAQVDSFGYDCYFQGQNRLWLITSGCWAPSYEFHDWSNVMCVLRTDIWYRSIQRFVVTAVPSAEKK